MTAQICLDKYRSAGEAKVARKLIARILEAGYYVSVCDGEEWTVSKSQDNDVIVAALGTTDMDSVRIAELVDDKHVRIGHFTLIYGNDADGSELVADCSWTRDNLQHESIITSLCEDL